jgi:hypothetical protein
VRKGTQIFQLFIMYFSPCPVTWSLLGTNTFLNILFSNTYWLRSSLNVSDQILHPYKTTDKIIFLHILIFMFMDWKLVDKWFWAEWQQSFPKVNLPVICWWMEFGYFNIDPKYLNSPTLSIEQLSQLTLWFRPALWSRDINMYLDLSEFTSNPISIVTINQGSAFPFTVCTLSPSMLTSSA